MKKILLLLLVAILLTGCGVKNQKNKNTDEDPLTNQYHFYRDAINKANNAKNSLENINPNINAE